MPVEELAGPAIRALAWLLFEVFFEIFFGVLCYFAGLFTLRTLSFGSFPPRKMTSRHETICRIVGLCEFLAAFISIGFWLVSAHAA